MFVNVTGISAGSQVNTTGAVTSNEAGFGLPASATLSVVAPTSVMKAFGGPNSPVNGTTQLMINVSNPVANTVALTGAAFRTTCPRGSRSQARTG